MLVVIAAIVLVGVLCLLDLVLTVGVIRRLREHSVALSTMSATGRFPPSISVGDQVGRFTAISVDDAPLRDDMLTAPTLVGFFSPTCEPCKELLPAFQAFARRMPGGPDRVVAVVVADSDEADMLVSELRQVGRVVVEERSGGALSAAFGVWVYPTVLMTARERDGRLMITENKVDLGNPAAARA
jgi:thiol-disulfide isomerase/thioredoxin